MSSPAEPKRRRLDDDSTSSTGVSFVAQDVSENASSKLKTEPATGGDADEDVDLHAQLKVAVERRKEAQAGLKTLSSKEVEAKNWLDHQMSFEMRELKREHNEEERELKRKHDEELRQLYTRQKADRRNLDAKHETDRAEHDNIWVPKFEGCNTKLEKRKTTEMTIRSEIRERGQTEADSLLVVGNDGITAILPFLTAPELGRYEMTCRALKRLSQGSAHWGYLEKYQSVMKRSSASTARMRVVRYHEASKFAKRLEPLFEDHLMYPGDGPECNGCSKFPSKTLTNPSPIEYELFVRFSKMESNDYAVLFEGFIDYELYDAPRPFSSDYPSILSFNMDSFDLSKWSTMETLFRLDGGKENPQLNAAVLDSLEDLIVTVVAVAKSTSRAHLVAGSYEFGHEETDDNGKTTFYTNKDLGVFPHEGRKKSIAGVSMCCLAFKWNNDRPSSQKFECHLVDTTRQY